MNDRATVTPAILAAAGRIRTLVRDLRRRAELEWDRMRGCFVVPDDILSNPDVATYDRIRGGTESQRGCDIASFRPADEVIVEVIAAIIAEEMGKEAKDD